MATKTSKYVVQFEADTKDAQKNVDALGDSFDDAAQSSEGLQQGMGALDSFTGGFASKAKGAIGSIKGMTSGFKSMKVAIASTGIGLLVIAVGSLFTYFTKTKRGAEQLEKGMAWMSGFFGVLTDQIAGFGETIVNAFKDPEQAVKDLWEAIKTNLWNRVLALKDQFFALGKVIEGTFSFDWDLAKEGIAEIATATVQLATGMDAVAQSGFVESLKEMSQEASKAADASLALTKRQQELDDSNRALNLTFAKRRAEIKELNKIGEDTSKSDEERIAAIQKAIDIETELMSQREANAAEQVRIYKEQNALSESTAEDLDRLNQAEIDLANVRLESTELQTTLQNKLNTTIQQQEAERIAKAKEDADTAAQIAKDAADVKFALMEEGLQKELEAAQRKFNELELKAGENEILRNEIEEARRTERAAINKKWEDKEAADTEASEKKKRESKKKTAMASLDVASSSFKAIGDLATAFAGKSEAAQRKAFKIKKAADIAGATVDTIKGGISALTGMISSIPGPVGIILGAVAAAGVVASGIANIAKIKKQKFQGGGGGASASKPSIPNLSTASQNVATPPTPDIPEFGGEAENEPVQAYVVATEVQDSNEASQKIEDIATL